MRSALLVIGMLVTANCTRSAMNRDGTTDESSFFRFSSPAARDSAAVALSGCYSIKIGPWSRPVANPRLPERIHLDTARIITAGSRAWRVLEPAVHGGPAHWVPVAPGVISLAWSDQERGIGVWAEVKGSELSGTARGTFEGDSPRSPRATVTGQKIDCVDRS